MLFPSLAGGGDRNSSSDGLRKGDCERIILMAGIFLLNRDGSGCLIQLKGDFRCTAVLLRGDEAWSLAICDIMVVRV